MSAPLFGPRPAAPTPYSSPGMHLFMFCACHRNETKKNTPLTINHSFVHHPLLICFQSECKSSPACHFILLGTPSILDQEVYVCLDVKFLVSGV